MSDYNNPYGSTPPNPPEGADELREKAREAAQDFAEQATETGKRVARTVTEQVEVVGSSLVDRVKELVGQGNVRRIIIRTPDDKVMLEMSLTTGAVIGGVVTLAAWWLAALGAIAALVARVRIEIVREVGEGEEAVVRDVDPVRKVKVEVTDTDADSGPTNVPPNNPY